mgnify:CR=1
MPGISGDKCVIYVISVKSSYGEKYFFPDVFFDSELSRCIIECYHFVVNEWVTI